MRSMIAIDKMDSATGWTALGNDTTNLAASTVRFSGSASLEFDKADGAANTTTAGAYKTLSPARDFDYENLLPQDRICWSVYLSDLTDVSYVFVRLGSSTSNYLEWRVADTDLIAGWNCCDVAVGDAYLGGTGWEPGEVNTIVVGVVFDAQDDTLADIKVDCVYLNPAVLTRS